MIAFTEMQVWQGRSLSVIHRNETINKMFRMDIWALHKFNNMLKINDLHTLSDYQKFRVTCLEVFPLENGGPASFRLSSLPKENRDFEWKRNVSPTNTFLGELPTNVDFVFGGRGDGSEDWWVWGSGDFA